MPGSARATTLLSLSTAGHRMDWMVVEEVTLMLVKNEFICGGNLASDTLL